MCTPVRSIVLCGVLISAFPARPASGMERSPIAWWRFDEGEGNITIDEVGKKRDALCGYLKYGQGVRGTGLRFDGYTTRVVRRAADAPKLSDAFTLEAWIAPQEYSWNWTGIVDREQDGKTGYSFGINHIGQIGLYAAVRGERQGCLTQQSVPLLKWSHVACTCDDRTGFTVFINGRPVGRQAAKGKVTPALGLDLFIGMSHRKQYPAGTERGPSKRFLSNMVFDGLIDEVKIYDRALSASEIGQSFDSIQLETPQPLRYRVMPSGAKAQGRFGAYYINLEYCPEWDRLWRGTGPDVVVVFDTAPIRLVSWRGISYAPCWVTENGNWFSNEFMERGVPMGCAESMSDKQARFSHVKIIENSNARTVLFWRYSPVDIAYQQPFPNPLTGWGDWAEECYTVYPDGVAARKVVMFSTDLQKWHEWCQSLPIFQPGQRPEDVLHEESFLSLANLDGQSQSHTWPPKEKAIRGANIQVVHYKSRFKPFLILTENSPRIWLAPYRERKPGTEPSGMSMPLSSKFWWWNHWPVAQLPNDGRVAEVPDRPSHSFTSTQDSAPYEMTANSMTKIMLCGLTERKVSDLVPLARSWCRPPRLVLASEGFTSVGYDPTERAYVLRRTTQEDQYALNLNLAAEECSPIVNPAFVIEDWGFTPVMLKVNGKTFKRGKNFRFGHRRMLEGTDLIVWFKAESTDPLDVILTHVEK